MSFVPVVPFAGNAGWAFLQRTRASQQQAFLASPRIERNTDHFLEKIAGIKTAEDLVADRRLLEVALGAFGLDADIGNKYLIEKILSSRTTDPQSLANRFADKRYLALAEAFGFNDVIGPRTALPDFGETLVAAYENRQFEVAVGQNAPGMRLALGLERDLGAIADRHISGDAKWFTVMATGPVRAVFETALNMPTSVGGLDLDRQLGEFRARAERFFGVRDVDDFNAPEMLEKLIDRFMIRDQLNDQTGGTTGQSVALAILQGGSFGS